MKSFFLLDAKPLRTLIIQNYIQLQKTANKSNDQNVTSILRGNSNEDYRIKICSLKLLKIINYA